jgi:hypothetical protein
MELLMPVAAMVAFDTLFAVMTVLVKKALDGGLDPVVLIALRQFVGAAFLAPIAYFKERFVRKISCSFCFSMMFNTSANFNLKSSHIMLYHMIFSLTWEESLSLDVQNVLSYANIHIFQCLEWCQLINFYLGFSLFVY